MAQEKLDIDLKLVDYAHIYEGIDKLSQRVMQLVALAYRVVSKRYIYGYDIHHEYSSFAKNVLNQLSIESGKNLTAKELDKILNILVKRRLLSREYRCISSNLTYYLCKIATNDNNLSINLPIIKDSSYYKDEVKLEAWTKFELNNSYTVSQEGMMRLNLAIYMNDDTIFAKKYTAEEQIKILTMYRFIFAGIQLDEEWINSRLPIFQQILYVAKLNSDLGFDVANTYSHKFWVDRLINMPVQAEWSDFALLTAQLNQLNIAYGKYDAIKSQQCTNKWAQNFVLAKELLLSGNSREALKQFELSIREFSILAKRNYWFFLPEAAILYVICLIREQKIGKIDSSVINKLANYEHLHPMRLIFIGVDSLVNNEQEYAKGVVNSSVFHKYNDVSDINSRWLIEYAMFNWLLLLVSPQKINLSNVKIYANKCVEFLSPLAEYIYAEILLHYDNNDEYLQQVRNNSPYAGLNILQLISVKADWEYTLDKIHGLLNVDINKKAETKSDRRLAWLINPKKSSVEVVEQQLRKNGEWTSGKSVTITRLGKRTDLKYITSHDSLAMLAVEPDPYRRGSYILNFVKLIKNLVGHPCVFDVDNPSIQLELIKDEPELIVKTTKNGYQLKLSHIVDESATVIDKISASKYRVIELDEKYVRLCDLIGSGIDVPAVAKDRLLEVVCKINPGLKINADIIDDNLPILKANNHCHLQLTPSNDGLIANLFMRPFGEKGGYYFPAKGLNSQVAQDEHGKPSKFVRDFKRETKNYEQLLNNCPILEVAKLSEFEWHYDDVQQSLQLLSELHDYKQQYDLVIEWPKGESIKFRSNLSAEQLKIKVKSNQQWFEYDGEVAIDNNEVLSLKSLLGLLDMDNNSRFVQLDNGQFVALSESFKQQLAELKVLSEGNKVFNLNSGVLGDLINDANEAKVDKKWKDYVENMNNRVKFTPQLPSTLQAELRDYQLDGFNYLSRLSNWQIGACLADDMGLGKTVQSIALLLEQAQHGPSLVVAPTSVCFNWVEELNKFAPSLNVFLLHNESQREQLITQVTNGDVLICSYNLMQYESKLIAGKEWNLLILDEAQNIKNHTTKRFKAACELNAKRRIALSGTPIENHLGELWSIFRFLNPGLLGSIDNFQKKFINPIANKNHVAKQTLKNLIHPYMLRRTKSQVLNELPPKIEQSIYIEPSNEELAFYEAVRQRALDNIAAMKDKENKRFSILAEITRLRQACCHSSLVDENIHLENSKLAAFLELVQDLIENNHKVLVFSQYVRYLEIVKKVLGDNKIGYQYIDGSTPINQRKNSVAEFQAGNGGDVFLISLKAGGTGLNLTAADYVIILDPWWNPAVEDQAADRAHRMGQQRPVTVYRLIMKNSIEEKIIHMHKDKRDLAGDLLSGQDVSGKLSEDDLIGLMQKF